MPNNKIENTNIDKISWPIGVWKEEPDFVFWVHEETQYPCFIRRHEDSGHLCGYVVVHRGNFFCDKDWEEGGEFLKVHGGITYAKCYEKFLEESLKKHIPWIDEKSWVMGFDCGHAWDVKPAIDHEVFPDQSYRDIPYVTQHVELLAIQLKNIGEDNEVLIASIRREQLRKELKVIEMEIESKISCLKNKKG